MPAPSDLLERIAEAALPHLGEEVVSTQRIAREVWPAWTRSLDADARRAALLDLRNMVDAQPVVADIVKRLLPGRTGVAQASLERYLLALPPLLRFRVGKGFDTADEMNRWLPSAVPRFRVGDRPDGIGDRVLAELVRIDNRAELWLASNPLLPDRPPVVLAFLRSRSDGERMLAWHQRIERGGPVAALLAPEHSYLDASAPCVQLLCPPRETMAVLCREPGPSHLRLFTHLVRAVALLHRRGVPAGVGDLAPGDVFVGQGEPGRVALLIIEGPDRPDPRGEVQALGRIGRALGLGEEEALGMLLAECVAEDALRRPADAQTMLTLMEGAAPRPDTQPAARETLPARAASRKAGKVWDVLGGLEGGEPKREKQVTNSAGMPFVLIPSGTFLMGSPPDEKGRRDNEGPVHEVVIPVPIYVGVHPVTQEQYQRVIGTNPSRFQGAAGGGPTHPVECISWDDAAGFCAALTRLPAEQEAGRSYRLPTEAEWEFACRAGTATAFHFGATLSPAQARFDPSPRTAPVGSYPRSHYGLHDMHGNVWEWCADWFDDAYYARSPRSSPQGPESGTFRVLRGGSWRNQAATCRSAYRNALPPNQKQPFIGFRCVLVIDNTRVTGR